MKKNSGFTLIELMITMAIFGILTSYGLPTYQQLKLNKQMDAERNRLSHSLNFARNIAITQQNYIVVCPSFDASDCNNQSKWYEGWIVFIDYNRNRKVDAEDVILRAEDQMVNNLKVTSSKYRSKIRFNGMGFSPGTNVSINFCDQRGVDFAKSIIINNAGRIKQSKPISGNVCT